ncbi:hypothetical protein ACOME3_005745 [Neoechinorhynchus agilis]
MAPTSLTRLCQLFLRASYGSSEVLAQNCPGLEPITHTGQRYGDWRASRFEYLDKQVTRPFPIDMIAQAPIIVVDNSKAYLKLLFRETRLTKASIIHTLNWALDIQAYF